MQFLPRRAYKVNTAPYMFSISYFQTIKQYGSMTKWYYPILLVQKSHHTVY